MTIQQDSLGAQPAVASPADATLPAAASVTSGGSTASLEAFQLPQSSQTMSQAVAAYENAATKRIMDTEAATKQVEMKLKEAEQKSVQADDKLKQAEEFLKQADDRIKQNEDALTNADAAWKDAEAKAQAAKKDVDEKIKLAEDSNIKFIKDKEDTKIANDALTKREADLEKQVSDAAAALKGMRT